jgi:hypothetical protein
MNKEERLNTTKGQKLFNFLYNRDFQTSNHGSPSQIDAEEGWGRLHYLNEMTDEEFNEITYGSEDYIDGFVIGDGT